MKKIVLGALLASLLAACASEKMKETVSEAKPAPVAEAPKAAAQTKYLSEHPDSKVLLKGNCDECDGNEYNLGLEQRRADDAKKMLILDGAKNDQVSTVSYGEEKPKATIEDASTPAAPAGATPDSKARNGSTRVEATRTEMLRSKALPKASAKAPALADDWTISPSLTTDEVKSYLVKVEANREIKKSIDSNIPSSGQLKVWIGQPRYEPKTPPGGNVASGVLYTNTDAVSAQITPSFPDDPNAFKVEPKTSKCQTVESTGSTVEFTITPNRTGKFRVGASVELYKSHGCTGDVTTKTAEPITVIVTTYVPNGGLWEIAWSAFKNFFKEILAALFAVTVILFRKQLVKLFHIKDAS